jgi:hypothetical protein
MPVSQSTFINQVSWSSPILENERKQSMLVHTCQAVMSGPSKTGKSCSATLLWIKVGPTYIFSHYVYVYLFLTFMYTILFFLLQYWCLNSGPTPWATPTVLFYDAFFKTVSWTICPRWLQTTILLISTFWVGRIIGMSQIFLSVCHKWNYMPPQINILIFFQQMD